MNFIISGANGGLGTAVVRRFEQAGDRVAALYGASGTPDPAAGRFVAGDLADEAQAREAIDAAARWLGDVDGFVHLAGGFLWKEVASASLADWRAMFDANLATAIACVHAVLPHMAEGGAIVMVGAASAQPAEAGFGPYGAAKAGIARLTEALAAELAPRRIRVNAVLPGVIDTPGNRAAMPDADPAGRTSPAAIADAIAFLASSAARAVNGTQLPVTNPA